MHKTTKELELFYDSEAKKFSQTRQRDWPEFAFLFEQIEQYYNTSLDSNQTNHNILAKSKTPHLVTTLGTEKRVIKRENITREKPLRILELGCGDGRFLRFLEKKAETKHRNIEYTGVDISHNLLQIANKYNPTARRVQDDMVHYTQTAEQEHYDIVIAIASFHHLPNEQLRKQTLEGIYYTLNYEGIALMTNWCYSTRFKERFEKEIQNARKKHIFTLGKHDKNNILVPRKNEGGKTIAKRLYHIFSAKELSNLCYASGFTNIENKYITSSGEQTITEADGRNLFTSMKKTIWGNDIPS